MPMPHSFLSIDAIIECNEGVSGEPIWIKKNLTPVILTNCCPPRDAIECNEGASDTNMDQGLICTGFRCRPPPINLGK